MRERKKCMCVWVWVKSIHLLKHANQSIFFSYLKTNLIAITIVFPQKENQFLPARYKQGKEFYHLFTKRVSILYLELRIFFGMVRCHCNHFEKLQKMIKHETKKKESIEKCLDVRVHESLNRMCQFFCCCF